MKYFIRVAFVLGFVMTTGYASDAEARYARWFIKAADTVADAMRIARFTPTVDHKVKMLVNKGIFSPSEFDRLLSKEPSKLTVEESVDLIATLNGVALDAKLPKISILEFFNCDKNCKASGNLAERLQKVDGSGDRFRLHGRASQNDANAVVRLIETICKRGNRSIQVCLGTQVDGNEVNIDCGHAGIALSPGYGVKLKVGGMSTVLFETADSK